MRTPMPTVEFDGQVYKLKSRSVTVPDLKGMDRIEVLIWLNRNVARRGYQRSLPLIAAEIASR